MGGTKAIIWEFFHSFIFAMQKNHSYQIPSQYVLGALRAHGASTCHYLQTIANMPAWRKVVTPFFRLRPSSAEKEGKSASMTVRFIRKVRYPVPHPNLPQVGEGVLQACYIPSPAWGGVGWGVTRKGATGCECSNKL